MDDKHLLNLNPFKVLKCLEGTISASELDKIRDAISYNGRELVVLAESHLSYAETFTGDSCWRQKVSRGYYSCYTASRAVRLIVHGVYDVEVGDHKKIGELPDDFPDRAVWSDLLTKFRGDRNIADYDHTVVSWFSVKWNFGFGVLAS